MASRHHLWKPRYIVSENQTAVDKTQDETIAEDFRKH